MLHVLKNSELQLNGLVIIGRNIIPRGFTILSRDTFHWLGVIHYAFLRHIIDTELASLTNWWKTYSGSWRRETMFTYSRREWANWIDCKSFKIRSKHTISILLTCIQQSLIAEDWVFKKKLHQMFTVNETLLLPAQCYLTLCETQSICWRKNKIVQGKPIRKPHSWPISLQMCTLRTPLFHRNNAFWVTEWE